MTEKIQQQQEEKKTDVLAAGVVAKSVYGEKKRFGQGNKKSFRGRPEKEKEEFEQKIVDIARVTRVMAGGKRMSFRACVAIGDKKGRVAVGLAKGADVTMAVNKAVNQAKKAVITVSIVNETITHSIFHKKGAAKILLKPAGRGKGTIAGGATRIVLELAGIKNITSKNLGTGNKVNVVKCAIEALDLLRKVEKKAVEKIVAPVTAPVAEVKAETKKIEKVANKPAAKKTVKKEVKK